MPHPFMQISGRYGILHPSELIIIMEDHQHTKADGSIDLTFGVGLLIATYWVYDLLYSVLLNTDLVVP